MTKNYISILLLLLTVIVSGCVLKDSEKGNSDNSKQEVIKESGNEKQGLRPIVIEKLDTGQELRIYRVAIGSDVCYISEIVNAYNVVTSGGMSCG